MIPLPPHLQELDYTCGAAALRSIADYFGVAPATEAAIVADMGMGEDGSDPEHLVRAAHRYGLATREYRPMSAHALARCLDRGRPVMLMLQAHAADEAAPARWRDVWDCGHWVVAIGHDARGVYVADPLLAGARRLFTHADLDERWHDIEGPAAHRVERYGLAIWRQRVVHPVVLTRARGPAAGPPAR